MTIAQRGELIKALQYSQQWIESSLDLHTCEHSGFYQSKDTNCVFCEHSEHCQWLAHNDQFIDLNFRSYEEIQRSLEASAHLINTHMSNLKHEDDCHCETCLWVRKTYQLLDLA